jgi:hypothetical protein
MGLEVPPFAMSARPDEGEPFGDLGVPGEQLAELETRNASGDGLAGTPDLGGGLRFEVIRFELAGATM